MNYIDKSFFGIEPKEQIVIVNSALQTLNLVDRFFFIIYKLNENFEFHFDINPIQNNIINLSNKKEFICNNLFEEYGESAYSEYLVFELQIIFKILRNRFNSGLTEKNIGISFLNNYDHLLISRYCYSNWKVLIKQEVALELSKKRSLESIKNLVISSFIEIDYRTKLYFTWDLYQEELRNLNSSDFELGPFFSRQTISTLEDVEWIKNLTEDDVKNQKIIIHEKASRQKLINGINKMVDENLLSIVKYSEKDKIGYKKEIKTFINYIIQKENEKPSYSDPQLNLSFITKPKEFYKIFYYCSLNHKKDKDFRFIKSKKTEIAKIFDDTLNKSKNEGYSYSSLIRIVEENNPTKIKNGNESKRSEELLNHEAFNPIRTICRSDILVDFIN